MKLNLYSIFESINAQRKLQGSADDYEDRRNRKIIKDTVTKLSPVAMDYRMLSKGTLDEFTDYIFKRYIQENPYIKDCAKDINAYAGSESPLRYININFKAQQNCEYKIQMITDQIDLFKWASDINKSNNLNIEHTFNEPYKMKLYSFSDPEESEDCINKYDVLNSTDGINSFRNPNEIIETINKHFFVDLELQLNLIRIAVCPSTVSARAYYYTHDPGEITRAIIKEYQHLDKEKTTIPYSYLNGMLDGISFLLYMFPDSIRAKIVDVYLKNIKNIKNTKHQTEQSYNILFNEYDKYFSEYRKKVAEEFSMEF